MKVAIMTCLFAKRDMNVDSAHKLVVSLKKWSVVSLLVISFEKVVSGRLNSSQCFNLGFL